jgi:hypothetical protein
MVSRNATIVFAVLVRIAVVAAAPPPPPLATPALPLEAGRLPVVLDTAECSAAFLVRPNQFIVAISYDTRRGALLKPGGGSGSRRMHDIVLLPWSWSVRRDVGASIVVVKYLFNFKF